METLESFSLSIFRYTIVTGCLERFRHSGLIEGRVLFEFFPIYMMTTILRSLTQRLQLNNYG
jgi:hypothetical protein